jgi:uncharacterized Zn ribbon protein
MVCDKCSHEWNIVNYMVCDTCSHEWNIVNYMVCDTCSHEWNIVIFYVELKQNATISEQFQILLAKMYK